MTSRALALSLCFGLVCAACGGASAPPDDAGVAGDAYAAPRDAYREPYDAGPLPPYTGEHTFPPVELEPGGEVLGLCQSWTLNNDEELWVNSIQMSADPGWHHSNWMFVPETEFVGPDGTWRCRTRDFDEVAASTAGGAVFFAQSTQATEEEQRFPAGAAYRIPPRSRVIGSVHVLNFTGEPLSSALTFRIGTLPASEVLVQLSPLAIDNRVIEVPARGAGVSSTTCDFARVAGGELDFSVYYVLPHYHGFADGMRIRIAGGPRDGEVLFETMGGVGNVLGRMLDPPVSLAGARGLEVDCAYTNPGSDTITWGVRSDDEMCTLLAYTDAGRQLGGFATSMTSRETEADGTLRTVANCLAIRL